MDDKVSKSESHMLFVPRMEFDALKMNAEQAVNGASDKLSRERKY